MFMTLMIMTTLIFAPCTYMFITAETKTKTTTVIIRGTDSYGDEHLRDDVLRDDVLLDDDLLKDDILDDGLLDDDESTTTTTTTVTLREHEHDEMTDHLPPTDFVMTMTATMTTRTVKTDIPIDFHNTVIGPTTTTSGICVVK